MNPPFLPFKKYEEFDLKYVENLIIRRKYMILIEIIPFT